MSGWVKEIEGGVVCKVMEEGSEGGLGGMVSSVRVSGVCGPVK